MKFEVVPTDDFAEELKRIAKKYRGILTDVAELSKEIKANLTQGVHLAKMFIRFV